MDSDADSDEDDDYATPFKRTDLAECLRLQHAELEMLESMYPGELSLPDEEAVARFKSFVETMDDVDSVKADLPPNLSFDVKLKFNSSGGSGTVDVGKGNSVDGVELSLILPSLYPRLKPTIMLRSELGKRREKLLRNSMDAFVASQPDGDLYLANLISHVKDNVIDGLVNVGGDDDINDDDEYTAREASHAERKPEIRMWIYSHHIYSMQKRKFIVEWSRELNLTGFSMPGKPGIVCVEGVESAVDELWWRLRKLNWKRLAVKEREKIDGDRVDGDAGNAAPRPRRQFTNFDEISFDVKQGQGRNYHMDMGKFLDFLKDHDCERIFKLYFGVDGSNH